MGGLGSERGGPAQIRGCPGLLTPGQGLPSAAAHRCLSGPWGPSSSPGPLESRQLAPQVPPLAPLLTSEETMVQVPMPRQGCGGPRPPSPAQGTGASTAVGSGSGPLSPVCRRLTVTRLGGSLLQTPAVCSARPWALDTGPHCAQAPCPRLPPAADARPAECWHPQTGDRAGGGEAGQGPPVVLLGWGVRALRTPGQPGWAATWMCLAGRLSEPGPQRTGRP